MFYPLNYKTLRTSSRAAAVASAVLQGRHRGADRHAKRVQTYAFFSEYRNKTDGNSTLRRIVSAPPPAAHALPLLQTRLLCNEKKPCLQCKEALFEKPSECRLTSVRFLPSARVGFAPIRFRMLKVNGFNFSNPLPWVLLSSGTLDLLLLAKHTALTSLTSDTFFNFFSNPYLGCCCRAGRSTSYY